MGFETNGLVIPVILQRSELAHPVDDPLPDWCPLIFAIGRPGGALHVAVSDAIFRQKRITIGIRRRLSSGSGIAGVPIQH